MVVVHLCLNVSITYWHNSTVMPRLSVKLSKVIFLISRKSHYQNEGQLNIYGGNAIWNKYVFFSEGSYSLRCYKSDGEFIPDLRRSKRESTFAQVLVLGTISCCEIDDLSCLWIFERCRKLAK